MTYGNASFFGLQDEVGSIEVGKRADLLLLVVNPLLNIQTYNLIEKAIINGKIIEREDLSAK